MTIEIVIKDDEGNPIFNGERSYALKKELMTVNDIEGEVERIKPFMLKDLTTSFIKESERKFLEEKKRIDF